MNGRALLIFVGVSRGSAMAQPANGRSMVDIEVPELVIDQGDQPIGAVDDDPLELANLVRTAVKGQSTVQEAPAIVTVVTESDIKDRQFHDLTQLYDTVPGWNRVGFGNSMFHAPTVRGQVQAVQLLRDGISLFDPFVNTAAATRAQPMELVKQVEMITGPGGVLWGANSLLGILNIITKDAEDVDGVEVGGSLGDGVGDRQMGRAYVMVGATTGKLKVFAHASVETYRGPRLDMPLLLVQAPLPQPNGATLYGPLTGSEQARSVVVNLDAKITYDKLALRMSVPMGEQYNPLGISGGPSREHLLEDPCPSDRLATCVDPDRTSRKNRADQYDRYAVLEYQTRFANQRAGITARAYGIQFVRTLHPMQFLAPSALVPGGLSLDVDLTSYRAGAAFDGDVELTSKLRLLYGGEAFREFKIDNVSRSIQGPGTESLLPGPSDLTRVPILCPRTYDTSSMKLTFVPHCPLTFAFPATRTVLGAYVNPQWHPTKRLVLDLGVRLQAAPAPLGTLTYDLNTTLAGTVVWSFLPNWHLKLNYAQGFRPPVINNTASNGEAANIGGNPELGVETSNAAQVEINARIFKGDRRIRELSFRADGSYTRINNLIQVTAGKYGNSGVRGLASGEFLGKLYIQGGHRIELGYTWLQVDSSDRGRVPGTPENWFNLATVFSLITGKLTATSNLKVAGAFEDPNRLVEYRGLPQDATGVSVASTDLVLDRLPPTAELTVGLSFTPTPKLIFEATVYNALYGHNYQPDVFSDYEPHLEYLPNPYEGFRAYLSAGYRY